MAKGNGRDIGEIIEGDALDRAMKRSYARTVRRHRRLGLPLVVWRDGKVVEVPPEEIRLPGEDGASSAA